VRHGNWRIIGGGMSVKVALFSLNGASFALPVEEIRHILSAPRIFPLPLLRSEFSGVFLYQGEIVPLLNLGKRFGIKGSSASIQFTVVMSTELGFVGLPAGQVPRIVGRELGSLRDAEDEDRSTGATRYFIYAETEYPLLNIEELIAGLPTKETTLVLS